MFHTLDDVAKAFFKLTDGMCGKEGSRDLAELTRQAETSGTDANMLRRYWRVYNRAHANAGKYGYIGVGAISFADARLVKFQQRIGRDGLAKV